MVRMPRLTALTITVITVFPSSNSLLRLLYFCTIQLCLHYIKEPPCRVKIKQKCLHIPNNFKYTGTDNVV